MEPFYPKWQRWYQVFNQPRSRYLRTFSINNNSHMLAIKILNKAQRQEGIPVQKRIQLPIDGNECLQLSYRLTAQRLANGEKLLNKIMIITFMAVLYILLAIVDTIDRSIKKT